MGFFTDLLGTTKSLFQIEKAGVKLKNNDAALEVKAADGTTDAPVTVSKINVSGDVVDINSDATGAGADWKYTLQRPAAGMAAAVVLTLPPDDGTANQVLGTDGNGVLAWVTAGATSQLMAVDGTVLNFDTASPVTMFTLPINAVVEFVRVIIDTAFNGTAPTLSIGITGTVSKYMATTQVDLKGTAKDIYVVNPGEAALGTTEAIIATYVADASTAGAARIEVGYVIPS